MIKLWFQGHRRPGLNLALLLLPLVLSACNESPKVLEWDQLLNAAYPTDFVQPEGIAQLVDGIFSRQAAPGSATQTRVFLADIRSFGNIDEGSSVDAAPIMIADPGGSGTFIFLAAALNRDGKPEIVSTILLGDRIAVRAVAIEDHEITVRMRSREPDDPFAYLTKASCHWIVVNISVTNCLV